MSSNVQVSKSLHGALSPWGSSIVFTNIRKIQSKFLSNFFFLFKFQMKTALEQPKQTPAETAERLLWKSMGDELGMPSILYRTNTKILGLT